MRQLGSPTLLSPRRFLGTRSVRAYSVGVSTIPTARGFFVKLHTRDTVESLKQTGEAYRSEVPSFKFLLRRLVRSLEQKAPMFAPQSLLQQEFSARRQIQNGMLERMLNGLLFGFPLFFGEFTLPIVRILGIN